MKRKISMVISLLALSVASNVAQAKVSEQQAAQLGNSLTPIGAEQQANKDGSIPAWQGGITQPPAGYKVGDHHPDPYKTDKVLFEITSKNYQQYQAFLTPGQIALFKAYPDTFKMPVYQTHRSASQPSYIYDATKVNATRAHLIEDGEGVSGAAIGIPFPIPQNGLEAIWNHILRFRGTDIARWGGQAAPTASGDYTMIGFEEEVMMDYSRKNATPQELEQENVISMLKQKVTSPSRLKGTALLVHETLNQIKQPRQAWTYNTGQRRVRKAPNIAFDAPGTASDGLRTTDEFDMFNGSPSRYNWTLKGKQELYIPYNNYALHQQGISYDDILKPGHINPDYTRFEKHRVWVIEAELKPNMRHIYKKRVFYIDEDSWQISVVDTYDNRDELYRVNFTYVVNYYEVPTLWSTLDVYHDLNSRRYLALGLDNNEKMYDFNVELDKGDFTPQALRREGIR
ncbi:DUF1329 domain-containing protein [Catenovulum sp. 2E275]|uniref:DUF1329 domain-containing protein n=1 Tax=Catenovulum sp. 2E275 TaxID=2980497 RepID=UPI0021CFE76F|nr:DUF1329 domain-containing protein [Catenovulum sp. 2E275]MCU4677578.1 DUF1329 domain-containing protein [Catenovulum sp. 2E275]